MPPVPADFEPDSWHRHFAIESNNRAWDLAVALRTDAEDQAMLNAAHASAWHWNFVGTELNQMRAKMLLAEVHALLGLGSSALSYATEMRGYFLANEAPDWEISFTHTIYAHACLVAGDKDRFRKAYRSAEQAISLIADEEDREVVLKTFNQIPDP